jgi:hypothetical protein
LLNTSGEKSNKKALEEIKQKASQETLLEFPDFKKKLYVHMPPISNWEKTLWRKKLLAFYRRKLSSAQTRYTIGEQELLSIVETLEEFRNIIRRISHEL